MTTTRRITVDDVYSLDRHYQQLRADFILGKVHSAEILVTGKTLQPALLVQPTKTKPAKKA